MSQRDMAFRTGCISKTCFSHRIDNGTIYQKREPGGEWYAFRNAEVHQDDEASKLVSTDLVPVNSMPSKPRLVRHSNPNSKKGRGP